MREAKGSGAQRSSRTVSKKRHLQNRSSARTGTAGSETGCSDGEHSIGININNSDSIVHLSIPMSENNGEVFTKPWVADMMLDLCGYKASEDISSKRILEPSSGDGRFLIEIVRRLCSSADGSEVCRDSLYNSIAAFDIDESNVRKCRNNVSDILREFDWKEREIDGTVKNWIKHDDFLLQKLRGYDFVVGNPPYIRSSDISPDRREKYVQVCETMTMGTDLFVGFIENGLKSMRPGGRLCFICADRWMQNSYGRKLRRYILENHHMDAIVRMHDADAFEKRVSAYPAIMLINGDKEDTVFADCGETFSKNDAAELLRCIQDKNAGHTGRTFEVNLIRNFERGAKPWPLAGSKVLEFIEHSSKSFPSIEASGVNIGIGIATGSDEVFISAVPEIVEPEQMLPLLRSEDIEEHTPPASPKHWLINPWNRDGTLADLSDYPLLRTYFESNRIHLLKRHVVKKCASQWYRTIDKIKPDLTETPKLLLNDMSSRSNPIYESGKYYPHHNMYWITSEKWDMEVLGGLLLSKQIESVVEAYSVKMRGRTMRFQAQYLRLIHVPKQSDIESRVRGRLKEAFRKRDAVLATEAANCAFGLPEEMMY